MTASVSRLKLFSRRLPALLQGFLRAAWVYAQGAQLFLIDLVGNVPSHRFRRFMYRHAFGVRIGRESILHWQTKFYGPGGVQFGEFCNLGKGAFLDGRAGIRIGNRVATGSEIMIYTMQHDIDSPSFGPVAGMVVIDDYVYIGPRAIILPGVHIGTGAVVGAGAVVTADVPPFAVVGGVPAKFIRERNHNLDYRPDFQMPFQ